MTLKLPVPQDREFLTPPVAVDYFQKHRFMTTVGKIASSRGTSIFTLHKEGLFYRCYNEDAMLFAKLIKPYTVISKYV